MTVFDYAALAESIWADFNEFGRRAYLRKKVITGTAYAPTIGTPRDWPITAIDFNRRIQDVNGTLVPNTGRSLKVSTEGLDLVVPEKGDTVMIGSGEYPEEMSEHEIVEVRPKTPGGVTILYELDIRS